MTEPRTDEPRVEPAPADETNATDASAEASIRRPWTLQRKLIVTVVGITSFIMVLVGVSTSAILGSVLEEGLNTQVKSALERTAVMPERI